jgi:NTE family protein
MPDNDWVDQADGVFRGGGVKGLGLVGALQGCAAHPHFPIRKWVNVAGASAGAIIASYLAVYPDQPIGELEKLLHRTDFAKFADYPLHSRILGGVPNLVVHHGLARGDAFEKWFDGVLKNAKFDVQPGDTHSKLKLIAVDVTTHDLVVLPDDLPR